MSRKKLLRRAAAAVRQARAEGVDIPRQLTKRSKKKRTVVDEDVLEKLKNARKELKKNRKAAIRDTPNHDDFAPRPKATFSWGFEPGQLVTIKANPGKRALSMMRYSEPNRVILLLSLKSMVTTLMLWAPTECKHGAVHGCGTYQMMSRLLSYSTQNMSRLKCKKLLQNCVTFFLIDYITSTNNQQRRKHVS